MKIADEAEARYGRKVAWGASIGDTRVLFTHLAVPVMTRLRQDERRVLDTLVDAGVARSRSDALAWCVGWSASTPTSGWPACAPRWPRSTSCAPRARHLLAVSGRSWAARSAVDVTGRSQTIPRQTYAAAGRRRADGRPAAAIPGASGSPDDDDRARRTEPPGGRGQPDRRAGSPDDRDLHRPGDQRLGGGQRPAEEARLAATPSSLTTRSASSAAAGAAANR